MDGLETWAALIEIFMLCRNLLSGQKTPGMASKKKVNNKCNSAKGRR